MIVASVLVETQVQRDGSRCVVERHTWDDGYAKIVQSRVGPAVNILTAMQARVPFLEQQRIDEANAKALADLMKRTQGKIVGALTSLTDEQLAAQFTLSADEVVAARALGVQMSGT